MKNFWIGKVVIITGSAQGIGKEVARQLHRKGAIVVLSDINYEKLIKTRNELDSNLVAVKTDVTNEEDLKWLRMVAKANYGRIDYLINNAGIMNRGSAESTAPKVIRQMVDVNITGVLMATRIMLPDIIEAKGGIMFCGSVAGLYGLPYNTLYSVTKMALVPFWQGLRVELKGRRVYVGFAYIGFTENEPDKQMLEFNGDLVYTPQRNGLKQSTRQETANNLIKMIEENRPMKVFSLLGKILHYIGRFWPGLAHWIIIRQRKRMFEQIHAKTRPVEFRETRTAKTIAWEEQPESVDL